MKLANCSLNESRLYHDTICAPLIELFARQMAVLVCRQPSAQMIDFACGQLWVVLGSLEERCRQYCSCENESDEQ